VCSNIRPSKSINFKKKRGPIRDFSYCVCGVLSEHRRFREVCV